MIHNMQRIQAILSHPLFCESLHKIQELERDRIYCKHGLPHLLDVARIASLMAADRQLYWALAAVSDRRGSCGGRHAHGAGDFARYGVFCIGTTGYFAGSQQTPPRRYRADAGTHFV